jgi:hypothetical protein
LRPSLLKKPLRLSLRLRRVSNPTKISKAF